MTDGHSDRGGSAPIVRRVRILRRYWFPLAFLTGLFAFVGGWALVATASGCGDGAREVATSQTYQGWAVMVGLTFATEVFAVVGLSTILVRVWGSFGHLVNPWVTVVVVVLVLTAAVGPRVIADALVSDGSGRYPATLCHLQSRTFAVQAIGFALLVPGVVTLDWVRQCGARSLDHLDPSRFLHLSRALDRTMMLLGGIISVSLVATSVLRMVIVEAGGEYGKIMLVLFGLQLTALLLVLYWPAKAALNTAARRARDEVVSVPYLDDPGLVEKNALRTAIDDMLGVSGSPLEGFQAGLLIAAPLVTSLIGSLVGAD